MSAKNQIKNRKRKAWVSEMTPAFHFHSRYKGMSEEEIRRQGNIDAARAAANAPEVGRNPLAAPRQRPLPFGELTRDIELRRMRQRQQGLRAAAEFLRAHPPEQDHHRCVIPEEHLRERMEVAQMSGLSHFTIDSLEMLLNSRPRIRV